MVEGVKRGGGDITVFGVHWWSFKDTASEANVEPRGLTFGGYHGTWE